MNDMFITFLIVTYSLFQIVGCFVVGRAIYRMITAKKSVIGSEVKYDQRRAR